MHRLVLSCLMLLQESFFIKKFGHYIECQRKEARSGIQWIKTMLVMDINLSLIMVFLFSYHLEFYPNVGITVLNNWEKIIFGLGQGLRVLLLFTAFFQ
jgi:hypothetical protein